MIRIALAIAIILGTASIAPAQYGFAGSDCAGLLKRVQSVAKKLHVRPTTKSGIVAVGCGSTNYDVFELIEALIDRMDRGKK